MRMEFAERRIAKIPTASKIGSRPKLTGTKQGLRERNTGGTQGARKSSGVSASSFGARTQKRISLSGDPFFFALHQILGKISN